MDGRRPLHLPRLPRVRAGRRERRGGAPRRSRHRPRRARATSRRPTRTRRLDDLPADVADRLRTPRLLIVTKAAARSTVHRPDYLDYVGVKGIDADGRVTGERHFVGLWTALSYRAVGGGHPVPAGARSTPSSTGPACRRTATTAASCGTSWRPSPATTCSRSATTSCFEIATGILNLQERKQVRLFARRDDYGRFVSCLVYVPRDRYSANVVAKVEQVLLAAYGGVSAEHTTLITESVLARVHVLVVRRPRRPDRGRRRGRRAAAGGRQPLVDRRPARRAGRRPRARTPGSRLLARYGEAFPAFVPGGCTRRGGGGQRHPPDGRARAPARASSPRCTGPRRGCAEELRLKLLPGRADLAVGGAAAARAPRGAGHRRAARTSSAWPMARALWIYDFGLRAPDGRVSRQRRGPRRVPGHLRRRCGGVRSKATASTASSCWPA